MNVEEEKIRVSLVVFPNAFSCTWIGIGGIGENL
jgi:hypothetical protein